jgi:hypothetical protein
MCKMDGLQVRCTCGCDTCSSVDKYLIQPKTRTSEVVIDLNGIEARLGNHVKVYRPSCSYDAIIVERQGKLYIAHESESLHETLELIPDYINNGYTFIVLDDPSDGVVIKD